MGLKRTYDCLMLDGPVAGTIVSRSYMKDIEWYEHDIATTYAIMDYLVGDNIYRVGLVGNINKTDDADICTAIEASGIKPYMVAEKYDA